MFFLIKKVNNKIFLNFIYDIYYKMYLEIYYYFCIINLLNILS